VPGITALLNGANFNTQPTCRFSPWLFLMRAPLRLTIALAVLVAAGSTYLSFKGGKPSSPQSASPPQIAAAEITSSAAPGLAYWSTLEPAYRSNKIRIGNDNSLQNDQQAVELYGVTILPRCQICNYRSGERWACGQRAYIALLNILGGTTVDCRHHEINQPRIVVCRLGGSDIAELMLREGWATLNNGVTERRYTEAAAWAFTNKSGMWTQQPPAQAKN
jgi:endonuclease YncB( thermonuclease family)